MVPIGVIWNESIMGRSAEDVASSYVAFIRHFRDSETFVFWADNFSGQNKNWFMYTALVNEVQNRLTKTKTIIIKYFEPGHTFMSADSFHHKVEKAIRQKRRVEDFQDFVDIIDCCGKALVMNFDDFFDFPRGVSQGKYAEGKPKLEDVVVVKFERGSDKMFWKTRHTDQSSKSS